MNLDEITKVLTEIYNEPLINENPRHIVFWYDTEGEFIEDIDNINIQNVKTLKLTQNNYFKTRYILEKEDKTSNILIYANMPKPSPREDWLLDVLKYSIEFSTDKTTVTMRDLDIKDKSLIPIIKNYSKFFNNKERYTAFKKLDIDNYTEENVHIAVLSVLCKLSVLDFEEVTKVLLRGFLNKDNKHLENIKKIRGYRCFLGFMF